MGRWSILLVIAAFACMPNPSTTCDLSLCTHVAQYTIDPDFSAHEVQQIHNAMDAWTRATGGTICWQPSAGRNDLQIHRAARQDFYQLFSDAFLQQAAIGATEYGGVWLLPENAPGMRGVFEVSAAHELGHFLGLRHAKQGLMTPSNSQPWTGDIPESTIRDWRALTGTR